MRFKIQILVYNFASFLQKKYERLFKKFIVIKTVQLKFSTNYYLDLLLFFEFVCFHFFRIEVYI